MNKKNERIRSLAQGSAKEIIKILEEDDREDHDREISIDEQAYRNLNLKLEGEEQ